MVSMVGHWPIIFMTGQLSHQPCDGYFGSLILMAGSLTVAVMIKMLVHGAHVLCDRILVCNNCGHCMETGHWSVIIVDIVWK